MASAFAAPQTHNGGFRADKLRVTIAQVGGGAVSVAGLIFQNIQFSFTQQVTMMYEIGSNFVYYVGGRAQGTASIARVIGPARLQCQFFTIYGDLCCPRDIGFNASAGCNPDDGCKYTLKSAVLTTLAVSVNANDILVNEQLQFLFSDLRYPGVNAPCVPGFGFGALAGIAGAAGAAF